MGLALHRNALVGALVQRFHIAVEHLVDLGEHDLVLRALRPGERWHNGAEIQFQRRGEDRLDSGVDPEALLLGVGLDQSDLRLFAAGQAQVVQCLVVDAEEAAGGAIFGRHIGQRRAVGQRQRRKAGAEIFDETPHNAVLAQHVGGGQHQIGGGDAFLQRAGQLEADNLGDQHADGLAQHSGLGLDAANAPAQHAQTIDHGGVRIGADAGVWIGNGGAALVHARPHRLRDVFQVHLMADAGAGGHGIEIVQRFAAPFQEVITFHIAVIFDLDVLLERLGVAEFIHHHRVVDHQIDRNQRVDLAGIAAQLGDGIAHRGQIDHAGNAGEILQQHARGAILDLVLRFGRVFLPIDQRLNVGGGNGEAAVLETQQILKQHLHAERQARNVAQLGRGLLQRVIGNFPEAHLHRGAGCECVLSDLGHIQGFPKSGGTLLPRAEY